MRRYDFFVSYSRADGSTYSGQLAERLGRLGYRCFLDREEIRTGASLPASLRRGLERSSTLLLVGSPGSVTSPWVQEELLIFSSTRRRVIAIDLGGSLQEPVTQIVELLRCSKIRETSPGSEAGAPEEATIRSILARFPYVRRRTVEFSLAAVSSLLISGILVATFGSVRDTRMKSTVERILSTTLNVSDPSIPPEQESEGPSKISRGDPQTVDQEAPFWEIRESGTAAGFREVFFLEVLATEESAKAFRSRQSRFLQAIVGADPKLRRSLRSGLLGPCLRSRDPTSQAWWTCFEMARDLELRDTELGDSSIARAGLALDGRSDPQEQLRRFVEVLCHFQPTGHMTLREEPVSDPLRGWQLRAGAENGEGKLAACLSRIEERARTVVLRRIWLAYGAFTEEEAGKSWIPRVLARAKLQWSPEGAQRAFRTLLNAAADSNLDRIGGPALGRDLQETEIRPAVEGLLSRSVVESAFPTETLNALVRRARGRVAEEVFEDLLERHLSGSTPEWIRRDGLVEALALLSDRVDSGRRRDAVALVLARIEEGPATLPPSRLLVPWLEDAAPEQAREVVRALMAALAIVPPEMERVRSVHLLGDLSALSWDAEVVEEAVAKLAAMEASSDEIGDRSSIERALKAWAGHLPSHERARWPTVSRLCAPGGCRVPHASTFWTTLDGSEEGALRSIWTELPFPELAARAGEFTATDPGIALEVLAERWVPGTVLDRRQYELLAGQVERIMSRSCLRWGAEARAKRRVGADGEPGRGGGEGLGPPRSVWGQFDQMTRCFGGYRIPNYLEDSEGLMRFGSALAVLAHLLSEDPGDFSESGSGSTGFLRLELEGRDLDEALESVASAIERNRDSFIRAEFVRALAVLGAEQAPQVLLDLLDWPFCVGPVRDAAVREMERLAGRSFGGDRWEAIAWASAQEVSERPALFTSERWLEVPPDPNIDAEPFEMPETG